MLPNGSFLLSISQRTLLASSVPWNCPPNWWSALRLASPPSRGCRGDFVSDYLPIGPRTALPAGSSLAGSSDSSLAASGWVELAVGLPMGLEPEATCLPTLTPDCVSLEVFVDRMLTLSLLSWCSTIFVALGVAASLGALAFFVGAVNGSNGEEVCNFPGWHWHLRKLIKPLFYNACNIYFYQLCT